MIAGLELIFRAGGLISGQISKMKNVQKQQVKPPTEIATKVYPNISESDFDIKGYEFLRMIIERKYKEAYELLDEGFKAEAYPDLDSFKKYCKKYENNYAKDYSLINFKKESANTYTAEAIIRNDEAPANLPIYTEYLTLRYIDEKNYRISLRKFVMSKNMNESVETKGIKISVVKATLYKEKMILKVEIINSNPNPITIAQKNQADVWLGMLDNKKKSLKRALDLTDEFFAKADFSIKPGEKAVFNFPFSTQLSEEPTALFFSNIKSGMETIKTQLFFKEL